MKILFLSATGAGLSMASRMEAEGHTVFSYVHLVRGADVGKGLTNRVSSWRPKLMESDLVVCDSPGFGYYESVLRGNGRPVFACNRLAEMASEPKRQRRLRDLLGLPHHEVEEDSVECAVQAWYNGRGWVRPFLISFNEDRFMSGGVGPVVGSMGCLTIAAKKQYRLFDCTLLPLEKFLSKIGWRGPVEVRCSADIKGVSVTGIVLGFTYDSAYAFLEGLQEPLGDAIFETTMGIKKELKITPQDYMISVRISLPPWPHSWPNGELKALSIGELTPQALKHMHLVDVYSEDSEFKVAGTTGVICSATATGINVDQAKSRALRTAKNIPLPDKQFRIDIGAAAEKRFKTLQEYGYLSNA